VAGKDVVSERDAVRSVLGYMPDSFGVYPDMTVLEYLHFFAAAYGLDRKRREAVVPGLLDLTDLAGKRDALIDSLSKGMQQRLGLARALVHDPQVLLLDEPASGLDPRARIELREILRELRRMGKTILLSSHILVELAEICNRIGILERGRLVAQGSVEEILTDLSGRGRALLRTGDNEGARRHLLSHPAVLSAEVAPDEPDLLRVVLREGHDDIGLIAVVMVGAGISLQSLNPERLSLEEAFMCLTQGLVQ
jgi:ABC-2 type transport system ATP-binding protein